MRKYRRLARLVNERRHFLLGLKNTPAGYTWHHVEDGKTMMLVPSDIHGEVRHTGGASLIRKGLRP
ncbi:HNH endonuclease [Cytobacillus sp.]|uniref:HNH endonuclease signature motif containing protein n=1 Tax=Cytobacillus sp. TaxID=2675269 RepID=UPI00351973F3